MRIDEQTKEVTYFLVGGKPFDTRKNAENYIKAKEAEARERARQDALVLVVHDDHLKLLKRMYIGWQDCEFGAPEVNPKRPYGNSDVYDDMAEILGVKRGEDDWNPFTEEQRDYMLARHIEMKHYLQILVRFAEIPSGAYRRRESYHEWEKFE